MKRFYLKKIFFFKYSPFICNKLKKLKKKKWIIYKRFTFRNYLNLKQFYRNDFIKMKKNNLLFLKKNFKEKLNNKQWLKHLYGGIKNKKIKILIFKGKTFFSFVESRLDIVLFRTHLFSSLLAVRHLIIHKNIKVNSKIITNSGLILKPGDLIKFKKFEKKTNVYFVPMRFEISYILKSFIILNSLSHNLKDFFIFKQLHFHKIYSYFVSHKKN